MADGIKADHALRAKATVEQIASDFARRGGLRRLAPAEVPVHQLIRLEHAVALGDRDPAFIEGQLQRSLRRLAAGPGMYFLDQDVVLDVADGQRAIFTQ